MPHIPRHPSSRLSSGRRSSSDAPLDAYPVRFMLGLVASLLLLIGAVNLPITKDPLLVGWRTVPPTPPSLLSPLLVEEVPDGGATPPPTAFSSASIEDARDDGVEEEAGEEPDPAPVERVATDLQRMDNLNVLEFAEQQPNIRGGLSAYYINIHYPRAAQEAGIEGRLILEFIVEKDGTPTQVRVLKPLHALLDSAAVQALRATSFVPGRQNGETVRVRMRLPVRFELRDPGTSTPDTMPGTTTSDATAPGS